MPIPATAPFEMRKAHTKAAAPDRLTLLAFVVMVLLSGGSAVSLRFTYAELQPFWVSGMRFVLSALVFWSIVRLQRLPLPRGRALVGVCLYGVLGIGLSFAFIAWGLVETPASVAQVVMSLNPILTMIFASLHHQEQLRGRTVAGALLAAVGILVGIGVGQTESLSLSLAHLLAILLGSACIAESSIIIKLVPHTPQLVTNAVSMSVGAGMILAASWFTGEKWLLPVQPETWLAFTYLVLITLVVFALVLYVLNRWTASGTAYSFVLIPLVTVVVATSLAGEHITWGFGLGSALVLGGVWLGALSAHT